MHSGGRYEPDAVAVNVAQVPVVYHVPPLIMHPFCEPLLVTRSVPLPENEVPGVLVGVVVAVVVGGGVPVFGRYLIPVVGQLDLDPSAGNEQRKRRRAVAGFSDTHRDWWEQMSQFARFLLHRKSTRFRQARNSCIE